MDQTHELFKLLPHRLLRRERTDLLVAQKVTGDITHLHQESQVAALGRWTGARSLKNLHQTNRYVVDFQRACDQEKLGWVSAHRAVGGSGVGRDQGRLARVR